MPGDEDNTAPRERPRRAEDDDPVLPTVTADELAQGWGEDSGERSDDWYLRERPPHHG